MSLTNLPISQNTSKTNLNTKVSDHIEMNPKGARQLLMMGIEVLANHEQEREGLEVYVSEGRSVAILRIKVFNVIRWIVWIITILLNISDPIVTFIYSVSHYKEYVAMIWLSVVAFIMSVVFALSVSVTLSGITLIINIVLRIITFNQRYGIAIFATSRLISILSFSSLGLVVLFELLDEVRNSCK